MDDVLNSMQENILYLEIQVSILMNIMRGRDMIDEDDERILEETLQELVKSKKKRLDRVREGIF